MRKYLFFCLAIFITTVIAATADDDTFATALQTCSNYTNSGIVNTDGMKVKYKNQILGWNGDKCVYKEFVSYSGMDTCTTCRFTKKQINELVKVMRAYSTLQQYSGEDVDTSSISKAQNNPVVKVWNKYLQDSSVCTIDLPQ